ncbi:MAG: electron transfer flavoprotein subunit beta/FixA family protein [Firmicutes bacterium]|nr:electron transfer flavoprotein subunit beta/FixA family protein [Bacillota bacterium]
MNILVCIKQVPDTTVIKIDPVTNTLIREGVPAIVNPFDAYALEAAARIKDKDPETKIVVVSMGPENAKNALKEGLAIAADKAYLLSGRAFGGSDTLATSYILSNAVKKIEETEGKFDAIFCGKQAIDGDTAQVGPELAEHLGYPQVTCALECAVKDGRLEVLKEGQDANQLIGIQMPCVITYTKPGPEGEPRFPSIKRKMAANRAVITTITPEDMPEIDSTMIGLKGSPTHVKRSFVPVKNKNGMIVDEGSVEESSKKLIALLSDAQII